MPFKHLRRSRVDAITPRREDPNMSPVPYVCRHGLPGFINLDGEPARDEMCAGSQADGAAANHSNRKIVESGHCEFLLYFQKERN
jgi:hypothetical protein